MTAEIITFPGTEDDRRRDRRWFPRRLHVRIDIVATAPDDRRLCDDIFCAMQCLLEEKWFQDASYSPGHEYTAFGVTMRLTYTNGHGPTWFWRLWNRWRWGL